MNEMIEIASTTNWWSTICGLRRKGRQSNGTLRLVPDEEYYATWVQLLTAAHCVRLGPSPLPYFPWGGAWATKYGNLSSIASEMIERGFLLVAPEETPSNQRFMGRWIVTGNFPQRMATMRQVLRLEGLIP